MRSKNSEGKDMSRIAVEGLRIRILGLEGFFFADPHEVIQKNGLVQAMCETCRTMMSVQDTREAILLVEERRGMSHPRNSRCSRGLGI